MKLDSNNTLLYLAIGKSYIAQAILSIASLVRIYKYERADFKVLIFTDNAIPFEWLRNYLNLDVRIISHDWIKEAQGQSKFALRTKIVTLRDVLFDSFTNVIFVDTDTIFLRKIAPLFAKLEKGFCFLHKKEWALSEGRIKNKSLCPKDLNFQLVSGSQIEIRGSTKMWNSGVVGISARNRELLLDSLDLNDRLYKIYPSWHVEQLALSIVLQKTEKICACDSIVFHYWHNKPIFNKYTDMFYYLLDSGKHAEALNEARRLLPRMLIEMHLKYFLNCSKVWVRDLPGIYLLYKTLIKPIVKSV